MGFRELVKQFSDGQLIKEGFIQFEAAKDELPKVDPDAPQNDAAPMKMTARGMEAKDDGSQTPREKAAEMDGDGADGEPKATSEQEPMMAAMLVLKHILSPMKEDDVLGATIGKVMAAMADLETALVDPNAVAEQPVEEPKEEPKADDDKSPKKDTEEPKESPKEEPKK